MSTANSIPSPDDSSMPPAAAASLGANQRQPTAVEAHRDLLLEAISWCASGGEWGGPYVDDLRQGLRDITTGRPSRLTPIQLLQGVLFELGGDYTRRGQPLPEGVEDALRGIFTQQPVVDHLDQVFASHASRQCGTCDPPDSGAAADNWFAHANAINGALNNIPGSPS